MAGMKLRVKPEELLLVANETEHAIQIMRQQFQRINEVVNRSSSYWENESQGAYVQAYRAKQEAVEEALRNFESNVNNLRIISGTYSAVEAAAVEDTGALVEDVIV